MTQVCFHIGLAKAGSTFFRRTLFPYHSELRAHGNSSSVPDPIIERALREICSLDQLDFDLDKTSKELFGKINTYPNLKMVLSYEHLSSSGRADRQIIAERLKSIVEDAQIFIIIRRQQDLIRSIYAEHIKTSKLFREFRDINSWLEDPLKFSRHITSKYNHPIRTLNYYDLICKYIDMFGQKNVCVLPLEQLKDDRVSFITHFCDFMKIDKSEALRLTNVQPTNMSRSVKELIMLSLCSRLGINTQSLPQLLKGPMKRFLTVLIPASEPSYALNEKWESEINRVCGIGNVKLSKLLQLPLQEYEYPGCA